MKNPNLSDPILRTLTFRRSPLSIGRLAVTLGVVTAVACGGSVDKGTDSQTNWLAPCVHESDCGAGLQCFCGTCTTTCASGCDSFGIGASCITVSASPASACAPALPGGEVCSFSCTTDAGCATHGSDLRCLGGACLAAPVASTGAGGAPDSGPGVGGGASGVGGSASFGGIGGAAGSPGGFGGKGGIGGAGPPPTGGSASFGGASGTDGGDAGLAADGAPDHD